MRVLKLAVFFILGAIGTSEANTIRANSCNVGDVNAAVSSAADGDTVVVPGGTCTWTSALFISNKAITLQGAGAGATVIINGLGPNQPLVTLVTKASPQVMRITGFTWDGGAGEITTVSHVHSFQIGGNTANLRIDHNTFLMKRQGVIHVQDYVRGVIDNNTFINSVSSHFVIDTHHDTWGNETAGCADSGFSCGDSSFAAPYVPGSRDALYIESNTFSAAGGWWWFHDGQDGARVVLRYNTLNNQVYTTHGTERSGRHRGSRYLEAYGNTFNATDPGLFAAWGDAIGVPSGTALVFDNALVHTNGASINMILALANARQNDGTYRAWWPWGPAGRRPISYITCSGGTATAVVQTYGIEYGHRMYPGVISGAYQMIIEGSSIPAYNGQKSITAVPNESSFQFAANCAGTANNGGITHRSPWDGNFANDGYPVLDQPGAGQSGLIRGCPQYCPETMTYKWPNQQMEPIYVWNNSRDGDLGAGTAFALTGAAQNNYPSSAVAENRDFYNQDNNNCAPGSGSCSAGVGRGLLSQRPPSCTPGPGGSGPGVAYWATDQGGNWNTTNGAGNDGALFVCTAQNTWTLRFTPLTYPHPLVTGSTASSGGAPQAPANLRIVSGQ